MRALERADFHVLFQSRRVHHHTVLSYRQNVSESEGERELQMRKMQTEMHGQGEVEIEM